jgi:hypothetical protein
MIADDRIPLREAARRLSAHKQFRHTRTGGKQELLKLLQKGDLAATFDFPSAARPSIQIPVEFWLDVPSGDFQRQLASNAKDGKHGQFLLRPSSFIDLYAAWFKGYFDSGTAAMDVAAELTGAFSGVKTKREIICRWRSISTAC